MVKEKQEDPSNSRKGKSFFFRIIAFFFKAIFSVIIIYLSIPLLRLALGWFMVFTGFYTPSRGLEYSIYKTNFFNKFGYEFVKFTYPRHIPHPSCFDFSSKKYFYSPQNTTENIKCDFRTLEFGISEYNVENGIRKDIRKYDKDKFNILLVGDSYSFGWGAKDEETFASYIEKKYDHINIDNYSFSSYLSIVELRIIEEALNKRKYDLIIFQHCVNDGVPNVVEKTISGGMVANFATAFPAYKSHAIKAQKESEAIPSSSLPKLYLEMFYLAYRKFILVDTVFFINKIYKKYILHEKQYNKIPIPKNYHIDFKQIFDSLYKEDYPDVVMFNLEVTKPYRDIYDQSILKAINMSKFKSKIDYTTFEFDDKYDFYRVDGHLNKKGTKKLADQLGTYIEKYTMK